MFNRSEQLNKIDETDVLVCGGGVAGIAAALAAARKGAKVTLVEKQCALGGLATLGLITIFLPLCDGEGNQVIFGITEELLKLSIKYGAEAEYPREWLEGGTKEERIAHRFEVRYNANMFAILAEELLIKEGVKLRYNTLIDGVIKENNRIQGVVVSDREGRGVIEAKAFVDCTGDAVICRLAGEKTAEYNENRFASWYYNTAKDGIELNIHAVPLGVELPKGEKKYRGINAADETEFIVRGHGEILKDVLKKRKERGDDSIMPTAIPLVPELRMTRRLVGKYEQDESEIGKSYPDTVYTTGDWRYAGRVFNVPFRTLYGETENLLVAGRCTSATDSMWDIVRVIPDCTSSGEVAGNAAALVAKGEKIENINIKEIQVKNGRS